jgi:hypothetical protein
MTKFILPATILLLSIYHAPLQASYQANPSAPYQLARSDQASLEQAVQQIKHQTGGRILSARTKNNTHIIKVLMPSGKVRIFKVKAR